MSKRSWKPWPKAGDIVDCHFPETVGVPGPKERPALVLEVEEPVNGSGACVVTVAFATSRKVSQVYPGEFVISSRDRLTGLTLDTKVDLVRRHRLPYDETWFVAVPSSNPSSPRRGRLNLADPKIVRDLQHAIRSAIKAEALMK